MVRRALVVLCVGFMAVLMTSCGQTYKLLSITVTPGTLDASGNSAIYLEGDAAFQQLTVTATYSNTKTQDVTLRSTYQIGTSDISKYFNNPNPAPLSSVAVNNSGRISVVAPACTWDTEPTSSADTAWNYGLYPYHATITYTENGVTTTAYLDINVANWAFSCFDGKAYLPPTGFAGNTVVGY